MAKHHRKEHISARRKREEAIKQQNKKELTPQQKKYVWIAAAVAAVILLYFVAFFTPGDSLITWFGNPMFTGDNDVIASIDDRYYDVADWTEPGENWTKDESYSIKRDKNLFEAYYKNEREDAKTAGVYITIVAEKTVEDMRNATGTYNPEISEIMTFDGGKYPYQYFVTTVKSDADETQVENMVAGYVQTNYDCMVLFNLVSEFTTQDQLPTAEEMVAELPELLECLTLN